MRVLAAVLCPAIAAVAGFFTVGILILALTPQDSGVAPAGDWEKAIGPGVVAVTGLAAGLSLLRSARRSP